METSDVIAIWVGAGAGVIAIGGVVVNALTIRSDRKSNKESIDAAREVATEAAREAKRSADQAEESKRIMLDQQHDNLRPQGPADMTFSLRGGMAGTTNLWGEFTVQRDYRVKAEAVSTGGSRQTLTVDMLLRAYKLHHVQVEMWPDGRTTPNTDYVVIKFWPPEDTDECEHWSCRCGRDVHFGDGSGPGHWEMRIPVDFQDHAPSTQ